MALVPWPASLKSPCCPTAWGSFFCILGLDEYLTLNEPDSPSS